MAFGENFGNAGGGRKSVLLPTFRSAAVYYFA